MSILILDKHEGAGGCTIARVRVPWNALDAKLDDFYTVLATSVGVATGTRDVLEACLGTDELGKSLASLVAKYFGVIAAGRLQLRLAIDPICIDADTFEEGEDFEFSARLFSVPEAGLSTIDPVKVRINAAEVTGDRITEKMNEAMRYYLAKCGSSENKPVSMGDIVKLDVEISLRGSLVSGLSRRNALLRVGYGSMPAAFIDEIVGMVAGESKEFDFAAPRRMALHDDECEIYHAKVEIKGVQASLPSEITDEWVKDVIPGASSVLEFKAQVVSALEKQCAIENEKLIDSAVDSCLVERLAIDLAPELIEALLENQRSILRDQLNSSGITFAQYLEEQNCTSEELDDRLREKGVFELKQIVALDELFSSLGLTVTSDDINNVLATMPEGQALEMKRNYILSGMMHVVEDAARRYKAHRWLVETAQIESACSDI